MIDAGTEAAFKAAWQKGRMNRACWWLLPLAACGSLRTSFVASGSTLPPTSSESVRVFDLIEQNGPVELPDGVGLSNQEGRHLVLAPDYPSAAEPNRRIGDLEIVEVGNYFSRSKPDDWVERLRAEAAAHGANALVLMDSLHAVALWLSSAPPTRPAVDALLSEAEAKLKGYRPGVPRTVSLERVEGPRIAGKKGTCYALVLALDQAAAWSPRVRLLGLEEYAEQEGSWLSYPEGHTGTLVEPQAAAAPRALSTELACALADGPITVELRRGIGAETMSELGHGTGKLVLLEKTIDSARVKELEYEELDIHMFNTIPDHDNDDPLAAERDCIVCAGAVGQCRMHDVPACAPLQSCLVKRGHGTRVPYCLRER
jgi:hypothetical protein